MDINILCTSSAVFPSTSFEMLSMSSRPYFSLALTNWLKSRLVQLEKPCFSRSSFSEISSSDNTSASSIFFCSSRLTRSASLPRSGSFGTWVHTTRHHNSLTAYHKWRHFSSANKCYFLLIFSAGRLLLPGLQQQGKLPRFNFQFSDFSSIKIFKFCLKFVLSTTVPIHPVLSHCQHQRYGHFETCSYV